jgi:ubiquinone/menaquinone biosynthesis C-methylase UbiE
MNEATLRKLWDCYSRAGYERFYLIRVFKDHKKKLGELFLSANNGVYLDAGCGTGNMFELIAERIQPSEVYAVDWSEEMSKKAEEEARRLQHNSAKTEFKFFLSDLSKPLIWRDNFFDGIVANLLICYLACGWREALSELRRVLKTGGYLYLGTYLERFDWVVHPLEPWKHAPEAFLLDPVGSFRGLKIKGMITKISEEAKKNGAEFPVRQEVIDALESLGFGEMKVVTSHWGGAIVLRARLASKACS